MWREIIVGDIDGIDELVSLYNDRLDCTFQMDKDMIENTLKKKRDAHYYIFEGTYVKILMGIKHDIRDNTTYIFNVSSDTIITENDILSNEMLEAWDAYQLIVKMLLETFNRKVKLIKWRENIRIQSVIDSAVGFYAQYGIIATNHENHWLFELM